MLNKMKENILTLSFHKFWAKAPQYWWFSIAPTLRSGQRKCPPYKDFSPICECVKNNFFTTDMLYNT